MGLFDFDNPFERQVGGPFGPGGIFDSSGGRFDGNVFQNPFENADVQFIGTSEIRDGVQSPLNRFDKPINIPQGGDPSKTNREIPIREEVHALIDQIADEREAVADAAARALVDTATRTREDIQGQIDNLTGIFTEGRITDEEIARRDTRQADVILSELKQLSAGNVAGDTARGIRGGGAASAGAGAVAGAGIRARTEARTENIEFQKDFNAKLQLAVESVKSNVVAARAQLDTTIGLAQAQIELGRPLDPQFLMDAILNVEAIETGRVQFADIMQLSRDFAESQGPDLLDFGLSFLGNQATSRGFGGVGTAFQDISSGLSAGVFG